MRHTLSYPYIVHIHDLLPRDAITQILGNLCDLVDDNPKIKEVFLLLGSDYAELRIARKEKRMNKYNFDQEGRQIERLTQIIRGELGDELELLEYARIMARSYKVKIQPAFITMMKQAECSHAGLLFLLALTGKATEKEEILQVSFSPNEHLNIRSIAATYENKIGFSFFQRSAEKHESEVTITDHMVLIPELPETVMKSVSGKKLSELVSSKYTNGISDEVYMDQAKYFLTYTSVEIQYPQFDQFLHTLIGEEICASKKKNNAQSFNPD